jgi:hypothetical protein
MARFLIQSAHTRDDCLQALDEVLAQGPHALDRYDFGCAVGDHSNHVSCTLLDADNEVAARNTLSGLLSASAVITEVGKFTPEQIRSFHRGL